MKRLASQLAGVMPACFVLAQQSDRDRLGEIVHSWSSHELAAPGWLFAMLALLVLIVLVVLYIRRRPISREKAAPANLFRQAAAHIGLGLTEQSLLIRIAKHNQLPSALVLMLSPHTLTHHAREYVESLPERRRRAVSKQVQAIGESLFD